MRKLDTKFQTLVNRKYGDVLEVCDVFDFDKAFVSRRHKLEYGTPMVQTGSKLYSVPLRISLN